MHGEGNKHINHSQDKFIEQINFEWMVELLYLQHIGKRFMEYIQRGY